MSDEVVRSEGLGKRYQLGSVRDRHATLYETISSYLGSPLKRVRGAYSGIMNPEEFWALQDINFSIKQGEVVGILGRNGAGKSTLLRILSRITAPTTGRVTLRGRLASLLEVGTGFHPELSGRENVYLNATILGMRRREIAAKFDEIVQFAGVERFLDTPVKRYSSGMYVRLAFAVAAHVDADVLLVDEVLAVGDLEFQRRCLGKMDSVAADGRTVLFVSHNLTAMRNLCRRGLLLQGGRLVADDAIDEVIRLYTESRGSASANSIAFARGHIEGPASIRRVSVGRGSSDGPTTISVRTETEIEILLEVHDGEAEIAPFIHLHDETQTRVFSSGAFFNPELVGQRLRTGLHAFTCRVPAHVLNCGDYSADVMLVLDRNRVVATENSALTFRVHDVPLDIEGWHWHPVGIIRPNLDWRLRMDLDSMSSLIAPESAAAD